jgi:hypothetical protein
MRSNKVERADQQVRSAALLDNDRLMLHCFDPLQRPWRICIPVESYAGYCLMLHHDRIDLRVGRQDRRRGNVCSICASAAESRRWLL